jgi:hypothetical protein
MFSSVLNFFKKGPAEQENPRASNNEESIDEFLKNSSQEQEKIAKLDIKPEVSAYFLSLEELGSRLIKLGTDSEFEELVKLGYEKRAELFWEKLNKWK